MFVAFGVVNPVHSSVRSSAGTCRAPMRQMLLVASAASAVRSLVQVSAEVSAGLWRAPIREGPFAADVLLR